MHKLHVKIDAKKLSIVASAQTNKHNENLGLVIRHGCSRPTYRW